MSDLRVLELDEPAWHDFVASQSQASPFHHPAWARLLAECYGFSAFVLALVDATGGVDAGAPLLEVSRLGRRSWTSLPFTDWLELLGEPEAVPEFLARADELRREGGVQALTFRATLSGRGSPIPAGVIHELELDTDPDRLLRRFDKSRVRTEIRRAEREGVAVRIAAGDEGMQVFYDLHLRTRQRQGVPVQPRRFFDLLRARILDEGLGRILVADVDGRPAAAAIILAWNRRVIYKLAASDYELLRYKPNHALVWEAIRSSALDGNRSFDFGRSDTENLGLRAFKSGWGSVERPLGYTRFGTPAGGAGTGVAQRAVGALIRHSPQFVCRALGETLYRYAA